MNVLNLHCDDKPGIVAAVATCLANNQCNIEEAGQFNDPLSGRFFMRVVFTPLQSGCLNSFEARFADIATPFDMHWQIFDLAQPVKTLILVSKADHCLHDLLYRWRTKTLAVDIVGVASNHETCRDLVESHNLPFHHLPVTQDNKTHQEQALSQIIKDTKTELIALARYMQILSEEFTNTYQGRVINIHHSFLPGFKGANPYKQAYERGVKIIGATAHFATKDLDEGPIITQDTVPIDHTHTPQIMQSLGRDTESRTLARAIRLYTERRIFLHGHRTVVL
ncbi:MAG: formyltetrahydrofolate deformylase [Bdellovibrionales bacterium]